MRLYGKISTKIWQHSEKFRQLNNEAKLLYFYFHTCAHGNSVGCFYISKGYMMADLGWTEDAVNKGIDTLSVGLIEWNENKNIVKIARFLEHTPIMNKKHGIGAIKTAMDLPDCQEKFNVLNELSKDKYCKDLEELKGIDTLSKDYRYTTTTTTTTTNTTTNNNTLTAIEIAEIKKSQFKIFWDVFGDKRGKSDAEEAWMRIADFTPELADQIIIGARAYAEKERPDILRKNNTPKMAEGWIDKRRWEDEIALADKRIANGSGSVDPKKLTTDEWCQMLSFDLANGKFKTEFSKQHFKNSFPFGNPPNMPGCYAPPELQLALLKAWGQEIPDWLEPSAGMKKPDEGLKNAN